VDQLLRAERKNGRGEEQCVHVLEGGRGRLSTKGGLRVCLEATPADGELVPPVAASADGDTLPIPSGTFAS
jgi:hypothetical protein